MTELPLVIVNSQRGGPSTGLPTKTEQSDLYQAVYGRNGDAPLPVIAARSPSDAFECAIEACRLATRYMTPVMLLTDGYIANAAEPWKVPDMGSYEPFPVTRSEEHTSELQSLMRISYAVFCVKKKTNIQEAIHIYTNTIDQSTMDYSQ